MLTPRLLKKLVFLNSSLPTIEVDIDAFRGDITIQNFTFEEDGKDFSFKQKFADNEFVMNPRIVDKKSFSSLKNLNIDSQNKFSEVEDPFYDFDEEREQLLKKEGAKTKQQELAKININKKLKNTKIAKSNYLKGGSIDGEYWYNGFYR